MPGQGKYIPEELIHHIQSLLPVEESACTSVLAKSLHAWSMNPILGFCLLKKRKDNSWSPVPKNQKYNSMTLMDVERTITRYLHNNIPIKMFDLKIDIEDPESADLAEKWIGDMETKTSLTEFSLSVNLCHWDSYFTLPDELLLGEKLKKIRVQAYPYGDYNCVGMLTSHHHVIKCVSLRELHLFRVDLSEEALNRILSSCSLLVKIELTYLSSCFKTIKVKNFPYLYELSIAFDTWYSPTLEISDVPNLRVFGYNIRHHGLEPWDYDGDLTNLPNPRPFNTKAHSMSLKNVVELSLSGVVPDYACMDMITSGFPFLENLALDLETWKSEIFHFTSASIKIFSLETSWRNKKLWDVQIYAPNLISFSFSGTTCLIFCFQSPVSGKSSFHSFSPFVLMLLFLLT